VGPKRRIFAESAYRPFMVIQAKAYMRLPIN